MRTLLTTLFAMLGTAAALAQAALPMAEAEVRKIDMEARKITLRHGEIRNLGMPPMSMVFQLKDPSQLEKLQVGDKVRFTAENINGAYTVLTIETVKQ